MGDETTNDHVVSSDRALAATGSDGSNDVYFNKSGRKSDSRQSEVQVAPSSSRALHRSLSQVTVREKAASPGPCAVTPSNRPENGPGRRSIGAQIRHAIITFGKFVGPGFMIAVAYIDPGNYSTDIAAGASYRFRLLFIVLLSNLFAILLQSLCIKLGTVTGLNLAEACRAFLPRWLNYFLYVLAEVAIIATDIAEVSRLGTKLVGVKTRV